MAVDKRIIVDKIVEDDELRCLIVHISSRTENLAFHTKSDAVHVPVSPGITLREAKQVTENLHGRPLASRQKLARLLAGLDYKIGAEHFKLSLVFGKEGRFLANSRLGVMEVICPPHADFTNEKLRSQLHRMIEGLSRWNTRSILPSCLAFLSKQCGLPYSSVKINFSQGRWDSCLVRKDINLSYHLALLSPHLIDYMLLHELRHIREVDYSERFQVLPNQFTEGKTLALRGELRKYRMEVQNTLLPGQYYRVGTLVSTC